MWGHSELRQLSRSHLTCWLGAQCYLPSWFLLLLRTGILDRDCPPVSTVSTWQNDPPIGLKASTAQ